MLARLPDAVQQRLELLPAGLRDHVSRVRALAGELAVIHGVDADLVDLSAAAHDLARAMTDSQLLAEARCLGLAVGEVEQQAPILLHGPIAAQWLAGSGIHDERVLNAVRWHTSGVRNMDDISRVVFLADKLEPQKVARWADLEPLVATVRESLDEALRLFIDLSIIFHIQQGHPISLVTLDLRNTLLPAHLRNT